MAKVELRPIEKPVEHEVILTLTEIEAQKLHAILFSGIQGHEPDLAKIQLALGKAVGLWRMTNMEQWAKWSRNEIEIEKGY